ncbi:amidase [Marinobacterium mangrovicola]|uniref:Asp-tRNA(Asn)/Glu-tRNA(Gln) amidotransferase A subunit family amidase n=1 Tax=Marinobacterium mangrovicola TaxID=1476959 RepID=A0A4R1GFQ8_9GAMM|nr:amidase [Marinobacterium mangrovicola]TCK05733.1 Asp-tRNA(Asn)/Glu-tRNA(Gln) amidotransferase A subunit family amidase [Marinobacterium mangrovicola]
MISANQLSLIEAVRAISSGRLSSEALLASCLERIDERESQVGAWMHIDRATSAATAQQPGAGPLSGIPIGIKDLIDTIDMPTGYGSPIYSDHFPCRDAASVSELRNAGAILLGKTVSTEFAYFQPGKTANPHDLQRTPGGSSSGSAAAVADFHVPAALGTQTAGSIIRPASFCGVVGYKPSYGLLPITGIRALAPSMDHLGTLTRTVEDAGFLAAILGRRPELDIQSEDDDWVPKIGFCETPQWQQAEPSTQALLRDAAQSLRSAGAVVQEFNLPEEFSDLGEAHPLAMDYEVSVTGLFEVTNHADQVSARFRERFAAGKATATRDYDSALQKAQQARAALTMAMDAASSGCDVLICPSAPGEAPDGLDATGDPVFNRIWTFSGVPCINVPGLKGPNNLPVGLQVVGRFGDDTRLLKAARWIHSQLG